MRKEQKVGIETKSKVMEVDSEIFIPFLRRNLDLMGQTTDGKNIYWIGRNLVIIQDLTPIPKGQTQKSALQLLRGILNITLAP